MRKIYKIIPLILIFIMLFSVVVNAEETAQTPMYASIYDEYAEICIEAAINKYLNEIGGTREELFVYAHTQAQPSLSLPLYVYIGIRSNMTVAGTGSQAVASGSIVFYDVRYNYEQAYVMTLYQYGTLNSLSFTTNGTVRCQFVYVSEDVYNDTGKLLYACPKPLVEPEPDSPKNDFEFDIFDEFQNFVEQSSEYNDISQKQTVTENSNNPNDGVFQNILQAISGLVHTGNSITQQISNQIQNFVEQFFNNFAQSALGLLTEIKDSLGSLVEGIFPDNLITMIDQMYESGLDADGNFGIDIMFDYWFIPDEEFMLTQFENLKNSVSFVSSVSDLGSDIYNDFINLEPKSPTLVIPAGTYSVMTFENDYIFDFEWFIPFKKYTDPIVAAFLYIGAIWRLYTHLPGILAGVTGFVESPSFSALNKSSKKGD